MTASPIAMRIEPRARDLGGFTVRRALPYVKRRMVGPFIFLDEMGPATFGPGQGIDVRPHPHVGLATITWLYDGSIRHRDTTGAMQDIRPGDVNWMTGGIGITHSERTPPDVRAAGHRLHGLQAWIALPLDAEDAPADFQHVPGAALPRHEGDGVSATLISGHAFGMASPVRTHSEVLYVSIDLEPGASLSLPQAQERGVYVLDGPATLAAAGEAELVEAGVLAVLEDGEVTLSATGAPVRCVLLGGDAFPEGRVIEWNFVASTKERLEAAKAAWRNGPAEGWSGRFTLPDGDDAEFIPLPGDAAPTPPEPTEDCPTT